MSNFPTLLLALNVILNPIEISSSTPPKTRDFLSNFGKTNEQQNIEELDSQNGLLPDGAPGIGVHHAGPSSHHSYRQNPPASFILPARQNFLAGSFPHAGPSFQPSHRQNLPHSLIPHARPNFPARSILPVGLPHRSRSRSPPHTYISPPTRLPSPDGNGYGLDQLEYIRLISHKDANLIFKLRKYNFSMDDSIEILTPPRIYKSVPTGEQIVLSTLDDDVFAILDSNHILNGLYAYNSYYHCKGRAKININSRKVTALTKDEVKAIPVGFHSHYLYGYRIVHLNQSSGSLLPADQSVGVQSGTALPRRMGLPTRLPSPDGTGYGLDQLQFIRLIPKRNQKKLFKLQRYTFPTDIPFFVLVGQNQYESLPSGEYIVLLTVDGEIFAILESNTRLAGIYTYSCHTGLRARVKIHLGSGSITPLTTLEISEIPVGRLRPISLYFRVHHLTRNPPQHPIN